MTTLFSQVTRCQAQQVSCEQNIASEDDKDGVWTCVSSCKLLHCYYMRCYPIACMQFIGSHFSWVVFFVSTHIVPAIYTMLD